MSDLNSIYQQSSQNMQKIVDNLTKEFAKIRTDRAHPSLLDSVMVEYYNQRTPVSRVSNIIVEDARTLSITPFDKSSVSAIEKAIVGANIGLNPVVVGTMIKVPIPSLTEDRRKDLVKQVRAALEHAKVSVRNVRRDDNNQVKTLANNKVISLNEKEAAEKQIQKLTDEYIDKLDKIGVAKETDIMKV